MGGTVIQYSIPFGDQKKCHNIKRLLYAHDAVARVDGYDGPRYSGGQPAAQEQGGVRYLLVRHVALHRRPVGVGAAHIVETGY